MNRDPLVTYFPRAGTRPNGKHQLEKTAWNRMNRVLTGEETLLSSGEDLPVSVLDGEGAKVRINGLISKGGMENYGG